MADKIISDLESVVAVLGDMLLPLENSIGTFSGSVDDLKDYIIANFPDASQTVKGKIEIATDAEAIAGTDTSRAIVPSALASIYGASSQTNEITPIKVSGAFTNKIVKRGSVSSTNGATVTFAAAFPTSCQNVILTCRDTAFRYAFLTSAPSTSQFTFVVNQSGGSSSTADEVYWQAEGY